MACRTGAACPSFVRGGSSGEPASASRRTLATPLVVTLRRTHGAGTRTAVLCRAVEQKRTAVTQKASLKQSKTATGTVKMVNRRPGKRREEPPEEEEEMDIEKTVIMVLGGAAVLALAFAVVDNGIEGTVESSKVLIASFQELVTELGPLGYLLYMAVYAGLEIFLLPATPIALTGGALFGVGPGTLISAAGGTIGAIAAFTLGRTIAREPVSKWASGSKPFRAMERALNQDGFKVVLLVNLSPLASLANLLNYAYGTTSLPFKAFAPATFFSILPRTFATVQAGSMGSSLLAGEETPGWLAVGSLLAAVAATVYITGLAKEALEDFEEDESRSL